MITAKKNKKIVFITGTRADFGKLKSIILATQANENLDLSVFVTGMHLNPVYGNTVSEIYNSKIKNIHEFNNFSVSKKTDIVLSETIKGFSQFINKDEPDLIVVHGDRAEALAGALVGCYHNILVAHFEGGEISGGIDESLRHSVSKLAHIHFVTDQMSKKRLIQLGEKPNSIFVIGSPDIDLMNPKNLTDVDFVKSYYEINFSNYAIAIFHPVTTELDNLDFAIESFCRALIASKKDFVVIYPNNDEGSEVILAAYKRFLTSDKFRLFPSIRFEYFLTLINNSSFVIGNSSMGIRESPFYNIPTIDIGTRQKNRASIESVINTDYSELSILSAINAIDKSIPRKTTNTFKFGEGDSYKRFIQVLKSPEIWNTPNQKTFLDVEFTDLDLYPSWLKWLRSWLLRSYGDTRKKRRNNTNG